MSEVKIMIGGQALRTLGSDRHTEDVDFAVFGDGTAWRVDGPDGDILDMNAFAFTREVWASAKPVNGVADAQTLAELKGWALIQHCRQMNWAKVASDEYDLQFLGRECGILSLPILAKYEGQAAKEAERELTAHLRMR